MKRTILQISFRSKMGTFFYKFCVFFLGGEPNYQPNSFNGVQAAGDKVRDSHFYIAGDVNRFDASQDNNYEQPAMFWRNVLDDGARKRLVDNIVSSLKLTRPHVQQRTIDEFSKVSKEFGRMLAEGVEKHQKSNI